MDVALEERLLPAGGEHAVHRPARERHPQREHSTTVTCSPRSRTATSPKSTSASSPGRWDCGTNTSADTTPAWAATSGLRCAT